MPAEKMHADEVDTDIDLVERLLAAQFPRTFRLRELEDALRSAA